MCNKLLKVIPAASIYGGPCLLIALALADFSLKKISFTHIYVAKKLFAVIVTSPKRALL
jgi:hypothetical protein